MSLLLQAASQSLAVPLSDFAAHLRLSHGFAPDGHEEALLVMMLRSAMAVIERRLGKALITQKWRWQLTRYPYQSRDSWIRLDLPVAPLCAIDAVSLISPTQTVVLDASRYHLLQQDPAQMIFIGGRPVLGGDTSLQIEFQAGYGDDWNAIPPDLRQAVLLLAAHFYERRFATDEALQAIPFGVDELLTPYHTMRL